MGGYEDRLCLAGVLGVGVGVHLLDQSGFITLLEAIGGGGVDSTYRALGAVPTLSVPKICHLGPKLPDCTQPALP